MWWGDRRQVEVVGVDGVDVGDCRALRLRLDRGQSQKEGGRRERRAERESALTSLRPVAALPVALPNLAQLAPKRYS